MLVLLLLLSQSLLKIKDVVGHRLIIVRALSGYWSIKIGVR